MSANNINKLTGAQKQFLLSKTFKVLPTNPSDKNFSASQIQKKGYEGYLVLFDYINNIIDQINSFVTLYNTDVGALLGYFDNNGVAKKALADESGNNIKATYMSGVTEIAGSKSATFQKKYFRFTNKNGNQIGIIAVDIQLATTEYAGLLSASDKALVNTISNKRDKVTSANKVYITDDTGAQDSASYDDFVDGNFVRRTDNASGNIYVGVPTADNHATRKKYVDDNDASTLATAKTYTDNKVARANLVSVLGEASTSLNGLMSATDKSRLDTLFALLGDEADADELVNTINEVLAIFDQYPEGADLVSALASKFDKSDVYDGLDSDSATKALSAKQGKALKITVDGLSSNKADKSDTYTKSEINDMVIGFVFADIDDELDDESENPVENQVVTKELEKKANVDGNYPTMTVGNADALTPYGENSGANDTTPFVFQSTGGNSDVGVKAYLKALRGNTVAWNMIIKSSRGMQTINGVTFTKNDDGSYSVTGTASADANYDFGYTALHLDPVPIVGHKYLLKGCPVGGSNDTYRLFINTFGTDIGEGIIGTWSTSSNQAIEIRIKDGYAISGSLTFKPQLFDLTQMFGAGNEPTSVAEFNRLFPLPYYAYNAGELLSCKVNGIKNVGYNAFDGELEVGYYTNGSPASSNNYARSKNFIKVIAGEKYTFERDDSVAPSTWELYFACYDGNQNWIKNMQTYGSNPEVIQLDNQTQYIKIFISYGQDVSSQLSNLKWCFHLTWDGSRTGYEPYESKTYSLPNVELKSAGNAYDELKPDGTLIRRIGSYTFTGSESWSYYDSATNPFFFTNHTSASHVLDGKSIVSNGIKVVLVSTNAVRVYVNDNPQITSSTNMNAIFTNGTKMNYELATPTTEQNDNYKYQEIQDIDDYGTQEFLYDNDIAIPVPQGNDFFYPVDYKAFIDSLGGREDIEYDASAIVSHTELTTALSTFLSNITGYDETKTQTLKNVEGTFRWVDDE